MSIPRYALLLLLLAGLVAAILFFWGVKTAQAEPINCRAAYSDTEETICRNGSLRSLDRRVSAAYSRALYRGTTTVREQQRFLRNRDRCDGAPGCISRAYRDRLDELRD